MFIIIRLLKIAMMPSQDLVVNKLLSQVMEMTNMKKNTKRFGMNGLQKCITNQVFHHHQINYYLHNILQLNLILILLKKCIYLQLSNGQMSMKIQELQKILMTEMQDIISLQPVELNMMLEMFQLLTHKMMIKKLLTSQNLSNVIHNKESTSKDLLKMFLNYRVN